VQHLLTCCAKSPSPPPAPSHDSEPPTTIFMPEPETFELSLGEPPSEIPPACLASMSRSSAITPASEKGSMIYARQRLFTCESSQESHDRDRCPLERNAQVARDDGRDPMGDAEGNKTGRQRVCPD
jgi:hypothetical protein